MEQDYDRIFKLQLFIKFSNVFYFNEIEIPTVGKQNCILPIVSASLTQRESYFCKDNGSGEKIENFSFTFIYFVKRESYFCKDNVGRRMS